jgi:hypothetical protein
MHLSGSSGLFQIYFKSGHNEYACTYDLQKSTFTIDYEKAEVLKRSINALVNQSFVEYVCILDR